MRQRVVVLLLAVVAAAMVVPVVAGAFATLAKPTDPQFDKIQAAARAALNTLGMVDQRGCDRDNMSCLDQATARESGAFQRAATVTRQHAALLSNGPCRTTLLSLASVYSKRAFQVRQAAKAWHVHRYQDAAEWYYRKSWNRPRLDGLFLKYCSTA